MAIEVVSLGEISDLQGNATFIDPAHGNYVPRRCSDAIDTAPIDTQFPFDYDGYKYGFDVPEMRDYTGRSDIGAYEYTGNDTGIFCGSFDRF